jgi:hypothetical protein
MSQNLASFSGMFRTILLILLLFFAARLLGRIIMPMLSQKRKAPNGNAEARPEGEVRIEQINKNTRKNKSADGNDGEYVDYKEVD